MKEFSLPNVSVGSSGSEYFQVHFSDKQDSDDAYFLIQRQFESHDGGRVYVESHEQMLCGHYKTCCFMLAAIDLVHSWMGGNEY